MCIYFSIKKDRTPKGDGNELPPVSVLDVLFLMIKKDRTPKGDGNLQEILQEQ